jgi:hypothetical protein
MAGRISIDLRTPLTLAGVGLLTLFLAVGCADADAGGPPDDEELRMEEVRSQVATHVPVYVDSLFPAEEELRRFREGLEEPDGLRGGSGSRDGLVETLIQSLEAADTAAVASLAIDQAEFAWFYFPHSIYTAPPYELPPGLVWFQSQNRTSRGLTRLLRNYAGKSLYHSGYTCPDDGEPWGGGRIWHGCTVLGELPSGERVEERLFGSILEVDGRFKLVSFSNEL